MIYATLSVLKRRHNDYWTNKREEREETDCARRYYDGDQWNADEIKKLKDRNQPVVTYNEIQPAIDGIVGTIERLRQDPKAFPRTPKHADGAEVATNVLNYCLDANQWRDITPKVARRAATDALAGVEMSFEPGDNGDPDIKLAPIDAETFFYDPRAINEDFSDAMYMGVSKWVDLDVAKLQFPEHADEIDDLASQGGGQEEWNLNDRQNVWVNVNEKQVRLVEQWYRKGNEWLFAFYCGAMILREGKSEFYDEKGKTTSRYIVFSANVDFEGDRYSFVRNLKPIQDEINHRRSKGLHALNTIRVYIEAGSVPDQESVRQQINSNDGLVVVPPGAKVDEKNNAAQAAGNLEMLQEAKSQMDRRALSPPVGEDGTGPNDLSGRAIQLLQQAALAKIGPFLIGYRGWKVRVYRAIWNNIQRRWQRERLVRVTDDDGVPDFIPVNRMGRDETGRLIIENPLGSLDVDIIIDEGPDTVNLMQDTFEALTALASNGAPVPPSLIIEMSNLPSSTKKKVLAGLEQAQQQPSPEMQAMQAKLQLEQQKMQMDMQGKQAGLEIDQQRAALDAQTARFKVESEIQLKREVAAADIQIERERAAAQIEIEQMKANAGIAIKAETARIQADQAAKAPANAA